MDMFRSRRMKVSIATSFSSTLFLLMGTLASGQAFSVADREVHFYKGGGEQAMTLEKATGVMMGTTIFYNASRAADDMAMPPVTAHTSPGTDDDTPTGGAVEVRVPLRDALPRSGDSPSTARLAEVADDGSDHPTLTLATWSGGETPTKVTGVRPKGGAALTLQSTLADLASGEYHVTATFGIHVFNDDIGTGVGDIQTYTVSFEIAVPASASETGVSMDGASGTAIKRDDGGFDYPLGGGLFLKYEGMITDANGIGDESANEDAACPATGAPAYCVGRNDPSDDYRTVDASMPPTLWGDKGLTATGKHTFTYRLGDARNTDTHDTLNYSVLIVDPNVWGTTSATLTIAENSEDLSALNSAIASDRNSDGTAAADRKISFSLAKGGNVFRVTNGADNKEATNTGIPVLALHTNARGMTTSKIDYESAKDGMIEVQICASGAHVPMGSGPDGAQCYTLNLMVTPVNEAPTMQRGKSFKPVYLVQEDTLPSTILLTNYFTDPEGDNLSMTLSPATGEGATGMTKQTMSVAGGYDVTAEIVGGTVLSFSKKLPEGEVLTQGVKTYTFMIYANDGEFDSAAATYTINIKIGANTAPVWIGGVSTATWTIDENAVGAAFSDSVSATDVDGDPLTYELVGQRTLHPVSAPYGVLRLAGTCLRITNGTVSVVSSPLLGCPGGFNYEWGSTQSFMIIAKDNYGGVTPNVTVTVNIKNVNERPELSSGARKTGLPTQRIYKGGAATMVAVSDYITDPEGDAISFTCVSSDQTVVRVNTACTNGASLTAVSAGSATIEVIASNAQGTAQTMFSVIVKGGTDNNPPVFANGVEAVSYSVNENMRPGAVGSPIGVSDPDEGDNIILTTIPADSKFSVRRTSESDDDGNVSHFAVISLKGGATAALDHETEPSIQFIVKADDEWEGRDYLRVTINVADVNEPPTRTDMDMEDISVVENSTMEVDVGGLFEDQDEIDSDRLSITALVANPFVADVVVNAQDMAVITGKEPGSTDVTLVAKDSAGHQVTETFSVKVTSNNVPTVANAIEDMEISVSEIVSIDVSDVFADEDGGEVMVTGVDVSDEDVVLAVLTNDNTSLAVIGRSAGMAMVTVMAEDSSGAMAMDEFMVTVSEAASSSAPRVARELGDLTVTADVEELLAIGDVFEGESLSYRTLNSDPSIATLSLDGDSLKIMGHDVGSTEVSLIATNASGRSSIAMFAVLVETMPTAVGSLPAVVLEIGAETFLVDFADAFIDRDGDVLSYEVSIPDDQFIDWRMSSTTLLITALSRGSSEISIIASDPAGRSATQSFAISVGDSQIRAIAEQSLAGFGRAMLTSVTEAVGDRITSDTKSSDMTFKSWIKSLAKRYTAPIHKGPTASSVLNSSSANPLDSLTTVPKSFAFGFGDGGQGSWSVWSQSDSQSLDSQSYAVDTNSLYLGVDMKATEKLTLGLAVSRNTGEGSFEFGTADRTMANEMTTVIPYASFAPTAKSQVWTLVGLGRGSTEVGGGIADDSSALNMRMLSVGGRHELKQSGRWNLALRGDYASAQLSTASGADLSSDLNATVNRVRAGLESSVTVNTSRGTVTPFADIGLRNDGGTDLSGTGVEIAGGVRLAMKTFTLEAKGRTLAMHSAQSYREDGFSLKATMNPSGDGSGLSLSLAPRWGANADSTDAMFSNSQNFVQNVYGNASGQQAMAARVGYGMLVSNDDFLITPYVDYDQGGLSSTKMLVGTKLTSSRFEALKLELAVGSEEERMTGVRGAVAGIEATLRF